MISPAPPKVAAVEVVATQPTAADLSAIAHLSTVAPAPLDRVAYLVKIKFEDMPPVTSQGWALYVKDERIPKYWAYKDGIYFKVYDPNFLTKHRGDVFRFSLDGVNFIDTGKKLPERRSSKPQQRQNAGALPLQSDVLK
ncbi:MAG TPA: hypothetical protein VG055_32825 [Planctomycetaceae bacterium]|jgi:hypothetical protein|nr:hypothetical protein [Planctomycetaceae bacterium]